MNINNINIKRLDSINSSSNAKRVSFGQAEDSFSISDERKKFMRDLDEIEDFINTYSENGSKFKFPKEYRNLSDDGRAESVGGWTVFFNKEYISNKMNLLKSNYGYVDLVPFAQYDDSTNVSCFALDNENNSSVVVINPFWPDKPDVKISYPDFNSWYESESQDEY